MFSKHPEKVGLDLFPNILSEQDCNRLITLFDHDDRCAPAKSHGKIDPTVKVSTDLHCNFLNENTMQYNSIIFPAVSNMLIQMKELYPFLIDGADYWKLDDFYNIQHYKHGEGYCALHNEQAHKYPNRMMAWMIYLNDSPCGTEFPYQQITLEAKQGHGAVWSAAWTHPHKGVTPNIGDKYIATGWCVHYDGINF